MPKRIGSKTASGEDLQRIAAMLLDGDAPDDVASATGFGKTKIYEVRRTLPASLLPKRSKLRAESTPGATQ